MISRNLADASDRTFDLAVIGGGILGACHALEAVKRGLSVLLLERADFGGGVSWSSHRIVHGGLRYLQSMDLPRYFESVRERSWFLRHFPDCVRPLPCLMPLYNRGLKRTSTLKAALLANEALSAARNRGLPEAQRIPPAKILSREETIKRFPAAQPEGLRSAAFWTDGLMAPPQRLLMEILRWAASYGCRAFNYLEAEAVSREPPKRYAIAARDRVSGSKLRFLAANVVNCAGGGPGALDQTGPSPPLTLSFSALFDLPSVSDHAVAVSPFQSGSPMYFVLPYKGKILVGTIHLPAVMHPGKSSPDEEDLARLASDIERSIPGLKATTSKILRVFSGYLPAREKGESATCGKPKINFSKDSGKGSAFASIWGVKYTTARSAAEKALRAFFPGMKPRDLKRPEPACQEIDCSNWEENSLLRDAKCPNYFAKEEAAISIDDVIFRRTDWGTLPEDADKARAVLRRAADRNMPDSIEVERTTAHGPS